MTWHVARWYGINIHVMLHGMKYHQLVWHVAIWCVMMCCRVVGFHMTSHPIPSHPIPSHHIASHRIASHCITSHHITFWCKNILRWQVRHARLHMTSLRSIDTAKSMLHPIWISCCGSLLAHLTPSCCWFRVEWSPLLELYELTAEVKDENGHTLMKGLSAKVRLHLSHASVQIAYNSAMKSYLRVCNCADLSKAAYHCIWSWLCSLWQVLQNETFFVWAVYVTQVMCMAFSMIFLEEGFQERLFFTLYQYIISAGSLLLCSITLYAYWRSNFDQQELHGDVNQSYVSIKLLQAQS